MFAFSYEIDPTKPLHINGNAEKVIEHFLPGHQETTRITVTLVFRDHFPLCVVVETPQGN